MADRPVVVPEFGAYLLALRQARDLTSGQVEQLVSDRFGLPFAHAVLWRYEKGCTRAPDPAMLWALTRLYRIGVDDLLARLASERSTGVIDPADFAPIGITERSAGLGDEALAVARQFESIRDPRLRELVLQQIALAVAMDHDR